MPITLEKESIALSLAKGFYVLLWYEFVRQDVINAIVYLQTFAIHLFIPYILNFSFPSKILPALKFNDSIILSPISFWKHVFFSIHYSFYVFQNVRQLILTKYSQIVSYTLTVHYSSFYSTKSSWINLL